MLRLKRHALNSFVSQDYVDADLASGMQQLDQTLKGHTALLATLPAATVCVLEAASPYRLRLLAALQQAGQPESVVGLLSGRRCAQCQLRLSKTDRTDTQLFSQFGQAFAPLLHKTNTLWHIQLQRQPLLNLLKGQRTALSPPSTRWFRPPGPRGEHTGAGSRVGTFG